MSPSTTAILAEVLHGDSGVNDETQSIATNFNAHGHK